ncbi:MAG: polysaccharide deacetylase family protein [Actinobacteria bacterium]|nr:polysaccharide deacetylase family protein [Actinomycetota bacterium]
MQTVVESDTVFIVSLLTELLGYPDDARLLIITCDDLGFSHSANLGVYDCLRSGLATSASLMVPCPWALGAAAEYRGEDIGVHLTLNAEYKLYKWGPITHAPSLLGGDGGFASTIDDVWDHADMDEVRRECRAQIERAIYWGFDVSHLNSHLRVMQLRPEFFDVYLDLAVEFSLPVRLTGASTERLIGFPFRQLAQEAGVLFPDHCISAPHPRDRGDLLGTLCNLEPGVTEINFHPAADTPELRALTPRFQERVDDRDLLVNDKSLRSCLFENGITLIGYRTIRDLMRTRVGIDSHR